MTKRLIDKLGIDLNTVEGITKLNFIKCRHICDDRIMKNCRVYKYASTKELLECRAEHLLAEVPMKKVKRWELYNGDFKTASIDFMASEKYQTGKYPLVDFPQWLMEEVEVEDD